MDSTNSHKSLITAYALLRELQPPVERLEFNDLNNLLLLQQKITAALNQLFEASNQNEISNQIQNIRIELKQYLTELDTYIKLEPWFAVCKRNLTLLDSEIPAIQNYLCSIIDHD